MLFHNLHPRQVNDMLHWGADIMSGTPDTPNVVINALVVIACTKKTPISLGLLTSYQAGDEAAKALAEAAVDRMVLSADHGQPYARLSRHADRNPPYVYCKETLLPEKRFFAQTQAIDEPLLPPQANTAELTAQVKGIAEYIAALPGILGHTGINFLSGPTLGVVSLLADGEPALEQVRSGLKPGTLQEEMGQNDDGVLLRVIRGTLPHTPASLQVRIPFTND